MKKIISTISMALLAITFANAQAPVKTITGNLNGNVNWSNDTIYKLTGKVYVKAGGTLNIAPGTIIKGDVSTAGSCLIITRGGKINAVGTPTQPIVFTSSATPGNKSTGDWGGLVIAGNAKVNVTGGIGTFEGGNLANPDGTTSDGQYGGLNDLDNSGELKYVRIEYAGFPFAPNNELNGLTMGGVGSGTKISYIQVSYGLDDAFEWFGGTVNCDHLVSFRGNDDDFDTDFGFSGKVQFGVALRDTAVADAVSGANGFESDNDAAGSGNGPKTRAIFSNFTMVGPRHTGSVSDTNYNKNFKRGAHIRRNSEQSIFNSIFMGWPTGNHIDGDSCHKNADSSLLVMQNNVIAGCKLNLDSVGGVTWNISPWFNATANENTIYSANSDVMLTSPFDYFNPNFRPTSTSPMLSGAAFTNPKLANGFTSVNYRGAFGTDDWTADWTNFNPDTASYTNGIFPLSINNTIKNNIAIEVYPNPATNVANIQFNLPTSATVTLSIVDLNGKVVSSNTEKLNAGNNKFMFNTNMLSNGIYSVRLTSNEFVATQKLSVIK
jgi:hypothetical protein